MKLRMETQFQLLCIPLLFVGIFTFFAAKNALEFNSEQLEQALEIKSLANRSMTLLHLQESATKTILLHPESLVENSDTKIKAFDESLATISRIRELSTDPEVNSLVNTMESIYKEKLRPRDSMILEKLFDDAGSASQIYFSKQSRDDFKEFESVNQKIYQLAEKNSVEAKAEMVRKNHAALISIGLTLATGIFLTTIIILLLVRKVSGRMLTVSNEINEGAGSLNLAKNNIKTVSEELKSIAREGKGQIHDAAQAVHRISDNEKSNLLLTRKASDLAMLAKQQTDNGTKLVEDLNTNSINLKRNISNISEIMEIMNGIAFQTNVLSLNAAVEAAKAGEQGRGFSVVAAAVRELAMKSKDSAQKVASIIREGDDSLAQMESRMQKTRASFLEIDRQVETLTKLINDISQANSQQASDVEDVHKTLLILDRVSEQMTAIAATLENQSTTLNKDFETVDHSVQTLSSIVRGA
jgi:methyl-accepting chemotaxis protein